MSKQDGVTKAYLSNPATFADMFNAYLYDGRKVINSAHMKNTYVPKNIRSNH